MIKIFTYLCFVAFSLLTVSCIDYGPIDVEDPGFSMSGQGLVIVNEGNFMYGNASLSYYDIVTGQTYNNVFSRVNGINLGDVANSIAFNGNLGYIVVNNSGIVFVIDRDSFKIKGTITDLLSPRYIHFTGGDKAYISDLYGSGLSVVDLGTNSITGKIHTTGHMSTETMVQIDNEIFVSCWSYDDKILVIDSDNDLVIDSITVSSQPKSMVVDKFNKIWVMCDGYNGSEYDGIQVPELIRIDPRSRSVESVFELSASGSPVEITLNGAMDTLYYLNNGIWKMDVESATLPLSPFIGDGSTLYYDIGVDPVNGDIYIADAIDYVQPGVVYRFCSSGVPVDTLITGIIPGAFGFK